MHLASAFDAVWSWAFRMNTHSVESRFILIVSSALLLLIAPLYALFFYLSN